MKSGIHFNQGDIILVPFPFSDLSSIRQRPVLVLSNLGYNKTSDDIITCGITSNLKDTNCSVLIGDGDMLEGSLSIKSRIKVDKLFTLEKTIVKKKLGRISKEVFNRVKNELFRLV